MDYKELKEVLDKHKKWLNDEDGGERANLRGANLRWANISENQIKAIFKSLGIIIESEGE